MVVCRAVLKYVALLGYDHAYLLTDDFRLPAIQTYLHLGFAPGRSQTQATPLRWAAIHRQLANRGGGGSLLLLLGAVRRSLTRAPGGRPPTSPS